MLLLSLGAALLAVTIVLRRLAEIERRHKEEREKESETAGDEFTSAGILAAELCHAIASPLTVILGQCELARTRNEEDRRLRMIAEGARSITDSIDRYRSLVQPGSGACHPIDPEQCAEAAIHALKPLAKRRDVNVHMLVDCAPTIESNAFLLSHGVRQMLQVAIEASPQRRGDVTLAVGLLPVEGEPTHVAFAVADDGPGTELDKLQAALHPLKEGAGACPGAVGYSIVETIARSIGGALVLDSAPGHGTRATLKVPLLPSAATRAARRPAQLARTRG
jgi:signal transduction histidine kinase